MGQRIEEDGTIVVDVGGEEFVYKPGTSQAFIDEDIRKATSHAKMGNLDKWLGAGKAGVSALPKAAAGIAGFLPDIAKLSQAGREKLAGYLPEWAQSVNNAIPNPVVSVLSQGAGGQDLLTAAQSLGMPLYQPQNRTEQGIDTAVQTAATLGRNLWRNPALAAKIVGWTTAGTVAAGALSNQTGDPSKDNPYLRAAGGFIGGVAPAVSNVTRGVTGTAVKEALGPLTPQQIEYAKKLAADARAQGLPLTGTEALDRGHQMASWVYSSPRGHQTMADFFNARPGQVEAIVDRNVLSQTGPRNIPTVNAARAQEAATGVFKNLERGRTQAVAPYYTAAEYEMLPPNAMRSVANEFQQQIFGQPIGSSVDKTLGGFYKQAFPNAAPEARVGVLDRLYRNMRDEADIPQIGATGEQKAASVPVARVAGELGDVLARESSNIRKGRDIYKNITETAIEPRLSGDLGKLAGKGYDPAQFPAVDRMTAILDNTNTARTETIRNLSRDLNRQDKQAFPGMVQTYVENKLNAALKDNRSGPPVTAGQKFRQSVAGTPYDRDNFDEMLRGVARAQGKPSTPFVKGVNRMMEILERTGRTPGVGSQTEQRLELTANLGRTKTGDAVNVLNVGQSAFGVTERIRMFALRARSDQLAKILVDPDSVEKLIQLGKYKPNSASEMWMLSRIIQATSDREDQEQQ